LLFFSLLINCFNNKKIKTLTDPSELVEHAVYCAAVDENSAIMQNILKWSRNSKGKKLTHSKSKPAVSYQENLL